MQLQNTAAGSFAAAWSDFNAAIKRHEVWAALAWQDIRQKYKRSVLGPFWITLTMLVTISGMGPLYGSLFKMDIRDFIPYLALGIITWGLLSSLILEGCVTFLGSDSLIRSVRLPMGTYVFRMIYRNVLTFAHNLAAYIPVILFFGITPQWRWLAAIPGVLIIILTAIPLSFILGIFCARFRDMQQIIGSIVQLVFFMTPIFWKPDLLREHAYLANFNPLYLFIETIRGPIYGYIPGVNTYLGVCGVMILLYVLAIPLFVKYRQRIAFWV
ncbi:ABC transporter permease [Dyella japonica A8]|uniref:ABC transporter permease n=1 Tax=Dyella japonica A8 TaxID=1217721 RepID=A0A075K5F0_9GAMM|nr:ABC transporter permease [Dyella japonica A8]